MKIVVSGTYSTGKTTLTLALSCLTGIPATHARTMREILPVSFPGYTLEECGPSELMELGMRRFTERIMGEMQTNGTFVSDGCPLQEWLYGTTRLKTGFNPAEKPEIMKARMEEHPEEWKVFRETTESFGTVVKAYVRNRYDAVIHLPVEFPFVADGHRPASEAFRTASEQLLNKTYRELEIRPIEVRGNLRERLKMSVDLLGLPTVRNTDEAIAMAEYRKKHIFDAVPTEQLSNS
jgi:nicotinamide riboside kinase